MSKYLVVARVHSKPSRFWRFDFQKTKISTVIKCQIVFRRATRQTTNERPFALAVKVQDRLGPLTSSTKIRPFIRIWTLSSVLKTTQPGSHCLSIRVHLCRLHNAQISLCSVLFFVECNGELSVDWQVQFSWLSSQRHTNGCLSQLNLLLSGIQCNQRVSFCSFLFASVLDSRDCFQVCFS